VLNLRLKKAVTGGSNKKKRRSVPDR